MQFSLHK